MVFCYIVTSILVLAAKQIVSFAKECSNKIKIKELLFLFADGNVGGHKDP